MLISCSLLSDNVVIHSLAVSFSLHFEMVSDQISLISSHRLLTVGSWNSLLYILMILRCTSDGLVLILLGFSCLLSWNFPFSMSVPWQLEVEKATLKQVVSKWSVDPVCLLSLHFQIMFHLCSYIVTFLLRHLGLPPSEFHAYFQLPLSPSMWLFFFYRAHFSLQLLLPRAFCFPCLP